MLWLNPALIKYLNSHYDQFMNNPGIKENHEYDGLTLPSNEYIGIKQDQEQFVNRKEC